MHHQHTIHYQYHLWISLNNNGLKTLPWWTPCFIKIGSVNTCLHLIREQNLWPSCQTVSKASLMSIKQAYNLFILSFLWLYLSTVVLRINIWSEVRKFLRIPACSFMRKDLFSKWLEILVFKHDKIIISLNNYLKWYPDNCSDLYNSL